jgi:tRNA-specific 2-thiouridylase
MYVSFENQQSAIQEGQFVAWYKNEELLGSGVIA